MFVMDSVASPFLCFAVYTANFDSCTDTMNTQIATMVCLTLYRKYKHWMHDQ